MHAHKRLHVILSATSKVFDYAHVVLDPNWTEIAHTRTHTHTHTHTRTHTQARYTRTFTLLCTNPRIEYVQVVLDLTMEKVDTHTHKHTYNTHNTQNGQSRHAHTHTNTHTTLTTQIGQIRHTHTHTNTYTTHNTQNGQSRHTHKTDKSDTHIHIHTQNTYNKHDTRARTHIQFLPATPCVCAHVQVVLDSNRATQLSSLRTAINQHLDLSPSVSRLQVCVCVCVCLFVWGNVVGIGKSRI